MNFDEDFIEREYDRIDKLQDPEQQGYEAAPTILVDLGVSKDELLRILLGSAKVDDSDYAISCTLGAIRWLIDNR